MSTYHFSASFRRSLQQQFRFLNSGLYSFRLLWLVLGLFTFSTASAQYNTMRTNYGGGGQSDYALNIGVLADVPAHNLGTDFKTSPGFEAGVQRYFGDFVVGLHLGYRGFKPKQSNFSEYDEETNLSGSFHLSNYKSVALYVSALYQLSLGSGANLQAGLNLGNYFSTVGFSYAINAQSDAFTYNDSGSYSVTESQFYAAPRIGINFSLSDNLQLGLQARYNVFGNYRYNVSTIDGDQSSGTVYTSFAAGVGLTYRFP